ncbi:sugar phosphate isomerase/epimerase family protein [Agrococcus sp. ARC_14]|uniref:sugar phosphate isomerase/epimerase family protein n=1 Tax=Agrococcus sp. ARC_14 TaxID=2919927 RepID=UPI001F05A7A3|nr:sugar phosphate isomerase/epimerase family protein [Agrococcus sp. ARC_14]MCH1883066.1 sugar phosphate isomerase/epimerase [Agrococcus sp. ARC_14]
MRQIGINTWVWQSPLRDAIAPTMLAHVAGLGFDLVELPLEREGDLSAAAVRPLLEANGLAATVVGAMGPGRALVATDDETVAATQRYLRACIDFAADVGAPSVCGPFTAETGRTWRMDAGERTTIVAQLRERLAPVVEHAAERGVALGLEPLNRYETSIICTVEQALDALEPLLGDHLGLALDTYHLGIEERSSAAAIRAAGDALVHVQVCGNDRGAPGGDQTDWAGIRAALDAVDYRGPLVIESFTADNAAIAVAASIWRPLATTQDDLARDGLAFLRQLERA